MTEETNQVSAFDLPIIKIENFDNRRKLKLSDSYQIDNQDVFCLRFSPDDSLIASGNYDGVVDIYDTNKKQVIHKLKTSHDSTPVTCIRWRPHFFYKAKKVIMVANSDGSLTHWHAQSGKILFKITEQDNQVLACDYFQEGKQFCTGGKDFRIRIYDEATKQVNSLLEPNTWNNLGHSNRIFSVKCVDQNTIVSGGWDSNIFVWDIRTQKSVGNIYGPSISGDSVDYKNNVILTGQQIQFWDIRNFQQIDSYNPNQDNVYLYAAQYSKFGTNIAFGSSGVNTVQVINEDKKLVSKVTGLTKGCYSLDYANNSDKIVFYGGEDKCHIVSF